VTVVDGCSGSAVPAGTVCSSDPPANSVSPVGTTVVIEVAPQRHH
jgi:beta-lactam-binding protein with PASTA domain